VCHYLTVTPNFYFLKEKAFLKKRIWCNFIQKLPAREDILFLQKKK